MQLLFLNFLLMPLIAIILAVLMNIVKKKNALISNKKLIVFVLIQSIVIALPGFLGITGSSFSPWYYLLVQILYIFLGLLFIQYYNKYFHEQVKSYKILFQILVLVTSMALGGYLFALAFNWLSNINNGYIAATCILTLPLPLIFYWAYVAFIDIPFEIYNVWQYPVGSSEINFDGMDFTRLMVLELEFGKQLDDVDRIKVKAKAPASMPFGDWVKKFIDDYNYKFVNQPIVYKNRQEEPYGWIFYVKKSFFHKKRLLDPKLSIAKNKIEEHITIISKRVIEHAEEGSVNKNKIVNKSQTILDI